MAIDRVAFTKAYSALVVRTWTSEEYLDLLKNSPHAALAEVGLDLPATATVNVTVVAPTGQGKVEDQIARWEEGERTGNYTLVIPERPEDLDDMPLADEALLEVAGGSGIYCCCCTPCCCCT